MKAVMPKGTSATYSRSSFDFFYVDNRFRRSWDIRNTGTPESRISPLALASGHGRYIRGRSGRKKSGQGTLPDGGTFLGCRKVDFWFKLARKKPEIHFSTSEAGLSGQKSIKRTQKCVVLGLFRHLPKISEYPYAKNIIDAAFSFEDRSGATMFF